ncbi:hypothetical protein [Yinghuangia soli]|uniref:Uncharacterized protein n=1 Tax=Yinghuangia soli TaxID=2908204 RepID=A0AA41Q5Q7_9ACTN|nr:hypothetical protein [Yinghuangia soli]MCF2531727.1 hypothetical protein [Yinghuangia soli]
MAGLPCPSCGSQKQPQQYLCRDCWGLLPLPTRKALNRRDTAAFARLLDLRAQITAGTPLADITTLKETR